MTFAASDYILWLLDFALAGAGAFFAFRRYRSIWALWLYLGFWTFGDAAEFIAQFFGIHAYNLTYFSAQFPLLALEVVLTVVLCGEMVRERRRLAEQVALLVGLGTGGFMLMRHHAGFFHIVPILQTELVCCTALGILLAVAWIGRTEVLGLPLEWHWQVIAVGVLTLTTAQGLSFGLQMKYGMDYWNLVHYVRPVGEIIGLAVLLVAVIRRKPAIELVRVDSVGRKFEPTSVLVPRAKSSIVN
jgi:hypothetical protein